MTYATKHDVDDHIVLTGLVPLKFVAFQTAVQVLRGKADGVDHVQDSCASVVNRRFAARTYRVPTETRHDPFKSHAVTRHTSHRCDDWNARCDGIDSRNAKLITPSVLEVWSAAA